MHSTEHWRLKDPTSNPLGEVIPPIQGLGLGAQRSSQDILVNFLFCLLPLLEPSNGSHWILQIRPSSVNQENQGVKENSQRPYKPINHKQNLKPTKKMTNKWNINIKIKQDWVLKMQVLCWRAKDGVGWGKCYFFLRIQSMH